MTRDRYIALGFVVFAILVLIAIVVFGDNYEGIGWAAALLSISMVYLVSGERLIEFYREFRYDETVEPEFLDDPFGVRVTWKIFAITIMIATVLFVVWWLVFDFVILWM